MKFLFKEKKAVQAAARLIEMAGGEMNYLLLMKMLYIADREALAKLAHPITGDQMVSMDFGPALSKITNFVSQKKQDRPASLWHDFIPRPQPCVYTCTVKTNPGTGLLSESEMEILDEVFNRFKECDPFELSEMTHTFLEFQDPKGSSIPISFEDVLKAQGFEDHVIREMEEQAEAAMLLAAAK